MYTHTNIYMYIYIHTFMYVYLYVYIYTRIYVYLGRHTLHFMYIQATFHTHISLFLFIYPSFETNMYILVSFHIFLLVSFHMYVKFSFVSMPPIMSRCCIGLFSHIYRSLSFCSMYICISLFSNIYRFLSNMRGSLYMYHIGLFGFRVPNHVKVVGTHIQSTNIGQIYMGLFPNVYGSLFKQVLVSLLVKYIWVSFQICIGLFIHTHI